MTSRNLSSSGQISSNLKVQRTSYVHAPLAAGRSVGHGLRQALDVGHLASRVNAVACDVAVSVQDAILRPDLDSRLVAAVLGGDSVHRQDNSN